MINKQIHIYKYGQSHIVILHQQFSVTRSVSQQAFDISIATTLYSFCFRSILLQARHL